MLSKNVIAFRNQAIVINPGVHADGVSFGKEQVATVSAELMHFGYMLSPDAFEGLTECSAKFALNWLEEVITFLKKMTGDGDYKPLHEGFPQSVMAMNEYELYMHAIAHYWSNAKWFPDQSLIEKGYKYEHVEFKIIERISDDEFKNIFRDIAQANVPVTESDYKILEWFVKEYGDFNLPQSIPLKENLCLLAALGVDLPVKTPTDVLRIAHYLSTGKTDLILPPKRIQTSSWSRQMTDNPEYKKARFKKFSRSERRYLLGLLDKVANASEMVLKINRWLRLGEILHPGDYSEKYPKAFIAFDALRNSKVRSWYSKVERSFNENFIDGLVVLSQRPGEYARRLDSLLRNNPEKSRQEAILEMFSACALKVSNKVLFELLEHFNNRMYEQSNRKVFIPGARKPTALPTLPPFSIDIVERVERTIWAALKDKFALLNPMGLCCIDPELKKIPLPKNMKTLTDTLGVKVRGTRMPLKADKKVLRAYVHWTAGTDLDLSMEFANHGKDKVERTTCSYHNLRPFKGVYHSGDVIPNTLGKWAEYIDIVLDECPYRYGLITLRNFRGGSLKDEGAVLGFMEREHPEANKTWYPKTITDAYVLDSEGGTMNLAIIDFEKREWILVDEDANGIPISTGQDLANYIDGLAEDPKVSVYDLLKMHVEVRGSLIPYENLDLSQVEEPVTVFEFKEFCESYKETLKYML